MKSEKEIVDEINKLKKYKDKIQTRINEAEKDNYHQLAMSLYQELTKLSDTISCLEWVIK